MTLPVLSGLRDIAQGYDGFILDLWGVIHDGTTPYAGAPEALAELRRLGKKTVMLSNAPRRAATLVGQMKRIGIPRDLYGDVISSGEAVYQEITTKRDPWFAALGRRCFHLGTERDKDLFVGLDVDLVGTLDNADFILNTGPDGFEATVEDFAPLLDAAARQGLPMVCANPDLVVMVQGRPMICAGSLALYYQGIGGDVRYRGKPDPAIYDVCLDRLGIAERSRVLAVGDGFRTDVAGAHAARLDSLFVTGGIHAAELDTAYGQMPTAAKIKAVIASHGHPRPTAAIGGFVW